jgi:hypothetical protein
MSRACRQVGARAAYVSPRKFFATIFPPFSPLYIDAYNGAMYLHQNANYQIADRRHIDFQIVDI